MADTARQFRVDRCLGAGGFGEVYLARMRNPGGVESQIALKVLHDGLDPRSQAVQRLRDEGRLLGSLNHPAIVKVQDLVMVEGRVALVMEYVPGLDLEGCFEVEPAIGARAGVEVCARVADALRTAYAAPGPDGEPLHLVHRDIKPPNVRVGQHGDVKLLDFGIAKASDARREAKTQTSVMIGSPWYMAPERFDRVNDDPASDVYALGCTLFEVVAGGQRLFGQLGTRDHFLVAVDPAKHDAHVRRFLDPIAVDPRVRAVLEAMLAFEPRARPAAEDLVHRLEDLAEELPGPSLRKWARTVQWPDPPAVDGVLVGRTVTEHRISSMLDEPAAQPETPAVEAPATPDTVAASTLPPEWLDEGGAPDTVAASTLPPEWLDEGGAPTTALLTDESEREPTSPEPSAPGSPEASAPVASEASAPAASEASAPAAPIDRAPARSRGGGGFFSALAAGGVLVLVLALVGVGLVVLMVFLALAVEGVGPDTGF